MKTTNDEKLRNYVDSIVILLTDKKLSPIAQKARLEMARLADAFTGYFYDLKAELDKMQITEAELFEMFRLDILESLNKQKRLKAMQFAAISCKELDKSASKLQNALLDYLKPVESMSEETQKELFEL